jgi:PPK2 family polyphosphate:nucleotide phosphotransferase
MMRLARARSACEPSSMVDRKNAAPLPEPDRRVGDLLRLSAGPVDLAAIDTRGTPGFTGSGKADARAATDLLREELSDLQERLYAEGRAGGRRSLLLVLQGMDTSGKGGVVKHVLGLVNPMGVRYQGFGRPTVEELEHHFLWRVKARLPAPGIIGVFDRSHYEDVLVVRVHALVPEAVWSARYDVINRFEAELADRTRIVKCFLHISAEEQRKRLLARLDNPAKHWKYEPGDVTERQRWADYQQAYGDALDRCNTEAAPWYVIPADRKWYRDWAISHLLAEQLRAMALSWPASTDWDVETERARIDAASPDGA